MSVVKYIPVFIIIFLAFLSKEYKESSIRKLNKKIIVQKQILASEDIRSKELIAEESKLLSSSRVANLAKNDLKMSKYNIDDSDVFKIVEYKEKSNNWFN